MGAELKIYVMDLGVYGCIITVAKSVDEAREKMKYSYNYSETTSIQEHEINENFVYANLGDT
jgi:hypothetical protein